MIDKITRHTHIRSNHKILNQLLCAIRLLPLLDLYRNSLLKNRPQLNRRKTQSPLLGAILQHPLSQAIL